MTDIPPQAITAAAVALAAGIVKLRGIGAEMDSETEHWGRVLAPQALEAAAPHLAADVPTGIIRIEGGKLSEADVEELAARWKAAWRNGQYTVLPDETQPLGAWFAAARKRLGWTLRDAERESGVPNAHISQIETGAIKNPRYDVVAKLAAAYSQASLLRQKGGGT